MSEKPKRIDWEAVERDYRTGKFTLRELEDKHGVSYAQISRKAKAEGWTKDGAFATISGFLVDKQKADDCRKPGFVYVIYIVDSSGTRFSKIGMAQNIEARVRSHQTSSPFDVQIALAYFCGNMQEEESGLHALFAGKQVRGEWFLLDDSDMKAIAARTLQL